MDRYMNITPDGTKDYMFNQAKKIRETEEKIREVFEKKLPKVESMHPLFERDRAKKDYGKVELMKIEEIRLRKRRINCGNGMDETVVIENKNGKGATAGMFF